MTAAFVVWVLFSLALLGALFGFICGIWFARAGGVYVNRHGALDVRWPPRVAKRPKFWSG